MKVSVTNLGEFAERHVRPTEPDSGHLFTPDEFTLVQTAILHYLTTKLYHKPLNETTRQKRRRIKNRLDLENAMRKVRKNLNPFN